MRRVRDGEHGFSLIEVMVVVVILAVLVAIGLPTFMGMRTRAQETAAKDSAVLALKVAQSFFALDGTEDFSNLSTAGLNVSEPSRTFIDGAVSSSGPRVVSQTVPDAGVGDKIFVAAVQSESGACFYVRTVVRGGTDYGKVEGADCRAEDHGSVTFGPSW